MPRSARVGPVHGDRQAVAGCFGEPHAPRDDGLVDRAAEMPANLSSDISGEVGARVVHREHDALDLERGVQMVSTRLMVAISWVSPSSAVLALDRDEHRVGGGQCVDGQQAERWRRVDQDVVVFSSDPPNESGQPSLALLERRQFNLAPQVRSTTARPSALDGSGDQEILEPNIIDDGVVDRSIECVSVQPQPLVALPCGSRSITRTRAPGRLGSSQVDHGRGLADAPFWFAQAMTCPTQSPNRNALTERNSSIFGPIPPSPNGIGRSTPERLAAT